jgi:hypothetical protein
MTTQDARNSHADRPVSAGGAADSETQGWCALVALLGEVESSKSISWLEGIQNRHATGYEAKRPTPGMGRVSRDASRSHPVCINPSQCLYDTPEIADSGQDNHNRELAYVACSNRQSVRWGDSSYHGGRR